MNLATFIQQILAIVRNDAATKALPLLAQFFTNIAQNPTAINITVQMASLNAQLLAVLPGIEQDVLTSIAAQLNAEVVNLAKSVAAPAAH
jgi:hypothetical protein